MVTEPRIGSQSQHNVYAYLLQRCICVVPFLGVDRMFERPALSIELLVLPELILLCFELFETRFYVAKHFLYFFPSPRWTKKEETVSAGEQHTSSVSGTPAYQFLS